MKKISIFNNINNVSRDADMQTLMNFVNKHNITPLILCESYSNSPYMKWSMEQNWITDLKKVEDYILNGEPTPQFVYTNKYKNKYGKWIVDTNNPTIIKNIGLITGVDVKAGTPSNIIVFDLDVEHDDKGTDGIGNFKMLLEERNINVKEIMDTVTVRTPGGGLHLYYKLPENWETVRSINAFQLLMPTYIDENGKEQYYNSGIDILGNNGVIPLPGTIRRNKDGKIGMYKLIKDKDAIPVLPVALQELINEVKNKKQINTTTTTGTTGAKLDLISIWNNGIPQGERNSKLLQVAGRLRPSFSKLEDFAICMIALNSTICEPPLSNEELDNICTYVWNKHINNSSNNYPYPYYYDEKNCAIYKKENNDDEEEEGTQKPPTLIYKGYINLVGRRINIDTNEKGYVLESKDLQDYNKLILDGEQLFGSNAERDIKNIFARTKGFVNFPIGQGSTKPVLKLLYAQDIHKRTNNSMVDTYYTNRLGWVSYNNNKLFSYPSKELVLDSVECNIEGNTVANCIGTKGTAKEWIENVLPLLISSNNGKVMLLGSFSAPLVKLLDIHENSIIQLEGATSTGKTHCLEGCASVYGNEKYVKQWNSTPYAINVVFSSFGSFPIIFDDLKNISNKVKSELGNICYGFVQGESKLQGKAEGGLRDTMYFSSLLLTSSEYPITEELKQHEGATARVLVLPGSFLPVTEENRTIVNKLDVNSKKYYGAIGLDWCKYLIQLKNNNKVEELKELYETYRDILQANTTNNIVSRKCNTIALLQVTGHLLEDFLNKDYFNIDETIATLMEQIEESTREADINDNAFLDTVEALKLNITEENDIRYKGTIIGSYRNNYVYDNKEYGNVLIVQTTQLKEIINVNYNSATTLRAWGNKGYTVKDNKGKNSVSYKINGKSVRCTILILDKYGELLGSTDNNDFTPVNGVIPFKSKNKTGTDPTKDF